MIQEENKLPKRQSISHSAELVLRSMASDTVADVAADGTADC